MTGLLRRTVRSVWAGPTMLAVVLGCWRIGRPEVWRDEIATWSAATRTVSQLWGLLHNTDASSGAYYLFMHYWIEVFGDSAVALRMPSVLALAGATAVVALIGRRLFGMRAGLVSGLVFALIPAVSRYMQEARSYGLAVLGVALATLLLSRTLERSSFARWTLYASAVAFIGLMHIVGLAVLAGHAIVVALQGRRGRALIQWAVAAALGLLPVLPVVRLGLEQTDAQISWIAKPSIGDVWGIWPLLFYSAAVSIFVALAAACLFLNRAADRRSQAAIAAMAVLPLAEVWLVSHGDTSYWLARYLIFALPFWAIAAGAGIAGFAGPLTAVSLVVLAAIGWPNQLDLRATGSHDWWNYPSRPSSTYLAYDQAAAIIAANWKPGDAIAYPHRESQFMVDLALAYNLPARVVLDDVFAQKSASQNDSFWAEQYAGSSPPVDAQRIWVVAPAYQPDPLAGLTVPQADLLHSEYTVQQVWYPSGLSLALLEHKPER